MNTLVEDFDVSVMDMESVRLRLATGAQAHRPLQPLEDDQAHNKAIDEGNADALQLSQHLINDIQILHIPAQCRRGEDARQDGAYEAPYAGQDLRQNSLLGYRYPLHGLHLNVGMA